MAGRPTSLDQARSPSSGLLHFRDRGERGVSQTQIREPIVEQSPETRRIDPDIVVDKDVAQTRKTVEANRQRRVHNPGSRKRRQDLAIGRGNLETAAGKDVMTHVEYRLGCDVKATLERARHGSAAQILDEILTSATSHARGREQADDMTLVVLRKL